MESYATQENISYNQLTPDIIDTLNDSLSNLCITILKELYHSSKLQQKHLAANVHTTPSSLSNTITRLESIQPQLLKSERIGRSKYYSLTEIAKLYVSQEILPKPGSLHVLSGPSVVSLMQDTLDILHQFQKVAASDWDYVLATLLFDKTEEYDKDGELFTLFEDFIQNMLQLRIRDNRKSIYEIQQILNNKILTDRLDIYLDKKLERYLALEPLFKLGKRDYRKATQLIDYFFTQIDSELFRPSESKSQFDNLPVSKEQADAILHEFVRMKGEFLEFKGDKLAAEQKWEAEFYSTSTLIPYISEKCFSIYFLRHK